MNGSWVQVVPGVAALAAVIAMGLGHYVHSQRIAELEGEVDDLHDDLNALGVGSPRGLDDRIDDGEGRRRSAPKGRAKALPVRRPMGAGAAAPESFDGEAVPPEVEAAVRDMVREARADEREAEREARLDRISERIDARVETLAADAGLSADQEAEISAMWKAEFETMMGMRDEVRAGELEWSEARTQIEELRAENDDKAESLLSDDQYASYAEARAEMGPGGRGRGAGPGRGGPPPPPG